MNKKLVLKGMEILACLLGLLLIFKDFLFPAALLDAIYQFGYGKFALCVFLIWGCVYFSIGLQEKGYLKKRFNKQKLSGSLLVFALCIVLYIIADFRAQQQLEKMFSGKSPIEQNY